MTDEELAKYLGIDDEPWGLEHIKGLSPEKRASYVGLAALALAVDLWEDGLGDRPNAILDYPKHIRQRGF